MDICTAILAINPKAQVSVNAEDLDQITWHGDTTPISKADIQAKQAELKTAYNNAKYQRDRKEAYPEIGDQLDDLYKKGAFSDEMAAKIKKVKDDNPKS